MDYADTRGGSTQCMHNVQLLPCWLHLLTRLWLSFWGLPVHAVMHAITCATRLMVTGAWSHIIAHPSSMLRCSKLQELDHVWLPRVPRFNLRPNHRMAFAVLHTCSGSRGLTLYSTIIGAFAAVQWYSNKGYFGQFATSPALALALLN